MAERDSFDFHPRLGLPFTGERLTRGDSVTVAFFGGSITQAEGWRNETVDWLRGRYPASAIHAIPASIGGTGSDLGVYRMDRDLLPEKPDLVFVEFAVNDSGTAPDLIAGAMEGIVRKLKRANPLCEILFVYTITDAMAADLRQGRLQAAAAIHETVADHYGVPSIHMAAEVARLEGEGKLIFTATDARKAEREAEGKLVFARDGCHPYPAGHHLYAEAVTRRLPGLLSVNAANPVPLPAPMSPSRWEESRLISPASLKLSSAWRNLPRAQWPAIAWSAECLPELWLADAAGAAMEIRFTGSACGLFLVIGPACGQIEWTLDDQPPVMAPLFDHYCTYYRPSYRILVRSLPVRPHLLRIRLMAQEPDKAAILAQLNNTIDAPDRFKGVRFYLAAVLLTGLQDTTHT